MSVLSETITNEIFARKLLPPRGVVVIATSGGMDSMVMLRLLHSMAPQSGWKLVLAHFNHRLRGKESDDDAAFVQDTAERLDLECRIESGEVRARAKETGQSIEMAARELRHQFLAGVAREMNAGHVVVAHHADDQAELFLLRLLRGVMGEGLGGMKWQNPSPADSAILLVRPLLGTRREEIAQYARAEKIEFREDSSNANHAFLRNRIRHEALPVLRAIEPEVETFLLRAAARIGEQNDALKVSAREWLQSTHADFDRQAVALQRDILYEQLISAKIEPCGSLIEELRLGAGKKIAVGPGCVVWRETGGKLVTKKLVDHPFCADQLQVQLGRAGSTSFSGLSLSWQLLDDPKIERDPNAETFDAVRVGGSIILRHWRPGDRFQPIGFPTPAKLQDLFTSARLESSDKRKRVIAATQDNLIFWVEGLRIGELFKLRETSGTGLRWSWKLPTHHATLETM